MASPSSATTAAGVLPFFSYRLALASTSCASATAWPLKISRPLSETLQLFDGCINKIQEYWLKHLADIVLETTKSVYSLIQMVMILFRDIFEAVALDKPKALSQLRDFFML